MFILLVLVVALAGVRGYRWSVAAVRAPSYETAAVVRTDMEVRVRGSGTVVAAEKQPVRAAVTGLVEEVLCVEGQHVAAGELLFRLANENLRLQTEQSRLALEAARERLQVMLEPPSDDAIRAAYLRLRSAEQTRDLRAADVERLEHRPDIDGTVLALRVAVGDEVTTNTPLLVVVDDSAFTVTIPVSQDDIGRVAVGQRAEVSLPHSLATEPAVVTAVGREGSGTTKVTFPVEVTVANPGHFRSGMLVTVRVYPDVLPPVGATGNLQPRARQEVRARVAGRVRQVLASPGEPVRAGDRLIMLENEGLVLALEQAESNLELERMNYQALIEAEFAPQFTELDVRAQRQRVAQEEVTLASRLAELAELEVRAPFAGVIIARSANLGDKVTAGQVVCQLADYSRMRVTISVDELDIQHIYVGQPAQVTVPALPDLTWAAAVTRVATEGTAKDGVSSYDVVLTITEPGPLRAAMTANVSVFIEDRRGVLAVPIGAIRYQSGRKIVYVPGNDGPQAVAVETGASTADLVEVKSGLTDGEVVIISPVQTAGQTRQFNPFQLPSPIRR